LTASFPLETKAAPAELSAIGAGAATWAASSAATGWTAWLTSWMALAADSGAAAGLQALNRIVLIAISAKTAPVTFLDMQHLRVVVFLISVQASKSACIDHQFTTRV
jgi:hypothetical protein